MITAFVITMLVISLVALAIGRVLTDPEILGKVTEISPFLADNALWFGGGLSIVFTFFLANSLLAKVKSGEVMEGDATDQAVGAAITRVGRGALYAAGFVCAGGLLYVGWNSAQSFLQ